MAKAKHHGGGPFDPPSGQVTVEVPDGVTKTFGGGQVLNSLTNAAWARGGPDGGGFGAFPQENDSSVTPAGWFNTRPGSGRFRVG